MASKEAWVVMYTACTCISRGRPTAGGGGALIISVQARRMSFKTT